MSNRDWLQKDFYAVLGVRRDASEIEIKRAYRALALQHHPDANRGDPASAERFKAIAEAYNVLSRSLERSRYDRLRTFVAAARPTGFQRYTNTSATAYRVVKRPPKRGQDLRTSIVLSAREARRGITVPVEVGELGKIPRTVFVRVPAGTSDGDKIRIPLRGGYGLHGGEPGDLFVTAKVFSAQDLSRYPDLNEARVGRNRTPMNLRQVPKVARMFAHFLLNPNDVELNEALSRFYEPTSANWANEILKARRAARR